MSLPERLTTYGSQLGGMAFDLVALVRVLEQVCDSHPNMPQYETIHLMGKVANNLSNEMADLGQAIHQLGIEQGKGNA